MSCNDWPVRCTLMGCSRPDSPDHHHHFWRGHLETAACRCPKGGQPGTRPRDPDRAE